MKSHNNADTPVYTISTAATILGISIPTLRVYEKEGLIIPHKKESSHRLYSENDLERLRCIRKAIHEDKISIEGIKTLLSLIPCWALRPCAEADRENCDAYERHQGPCWLYKHKNNVCAGKECRECIVYREYATCGKIKESLRDLIKVKHMHPNKPNR